MENVEQHYNLIKKYKMRYLKVKSLDSIDIDEIYDYAKDLYDKYTEEIYKAIDEKIMLKEIDHKLSPVERENWFGILAEKHSGYRGANRVFGIISEYRMGLANNLETLNYNKKNKLTAPAIALFCHYVDASNLQTKESTCNIEVYCKSVCERYNLPYTDRVRQNYSNNPHGIRKNNKLINDLILPKLDEQTKQSILRYLDISKVNK